MFCHEYKSIFIGMFRIVSRMADNKKFCRPAEGYAQETEVDLDRYAESEKVPTVLPESDEKWPKGAPLSGFVKVKNQILKLKSSEIE